MQALFDLAGRPEYVAPLRQELERVISEDGGSRELSPRSLGKLVHMDSFLKESQRHVSQNLRECPSSKNSLPIAKADVSLADRTGMQCLYTAKSCPPLPSKTAPSSP